LKVGLSLTGGGDGDDGGADGDGVETALLE